MDGKGHPKNLLNKNINDDRTSMKIEIKKTQQQFGKQNKSCSVIVDDYVLRLAFNGELSFG